MLLEITRHNRGGPVPVVCRVLFLGLLEIIGLYERFRFWLVPVAMGV